MILDDSGLVLTPGNGGKDCEGNGAGGLECCCEECDYFLCCYGGIFPRGCAGCGDKDCPKKEGG